jgi:hypothetical protein
MKALAFVLGLLLLAAPAHAATLTITSGFVEGMQLAFDLGYSLHGDGFDLVGAQIGAAEMTTVFTTGVVDVNLTDRPPAGNPRYFGPLQLSTTPIPLPPVSSTPVIFDIPFTASGTLFDTGDTLVGQGMVEIIYCVGACAHSAYPDVFYTFTAPASAVPEPSSLVLLAVGSAV